MRGSTCPSWLAEAQWYPRLEATRRSLVRGHSAPGSCLSLSWDRSPDPSSKGTGDSSPPRAQLGLINRERSQTARPTGPTLSQWTGSSAEQNWQKIPARNRDTGIPVPGTDFPNALKQLNPRRRPTTESRAQATEIKPLEIVSVIKVTFEKSCVNVWCVGGNSSIRTGSRLISKRIFA